jgi:hypothetical protein
MERCVCGSGQGERKPSSDAGTAKESWMRLPPGASASAYLNISKDPTRASIDGNVLTAAGLLVLPRCLGGNVIFFSLSHMSAHWISNISATPTWVPWTTQLIAARKGKAERGCIHTVVLWSLKKKKKKRSKPTLAVLKNTLCCRPTQPSHSQERPR